MNKYATVSSTANSFKIGYLKDMMEGLNGIDYKTTVQDVKT